MTVSDYDSLFDRFRRMKVMIIGDVMVDAYIFGKVERISPEAPVPVVSVEKRENRLGGAANVALNIKALGADPVLCSVIGDDRKGEEFRQLLSEAGINDEGIVMSPDRITTTKFRVIGNRAQMLRVDEEVTTELKAEDESALLGKIIKILAEHEPDVIIFQDYNKGVLTPGLIRKVIGKAGELKIPVAIDPKKRNFDQFKGATLFKPNLKELREGLTMEIEADNIQNLVAAADIIHRNWEIEYVLVTLSENGVFISRRGSGADSVNLILPAHIRLISDVSGAGDTVISVAALCLAAGLAPQEIASLSNLAGGMVCEEIGVVPVNPARLLREIKKLS